MLVIFIIREVRRGENDSTPEGHEGQGGLVVKGSKQRSNQSETHDGGVQGYKVFKLMAGSKFSKDRQNFKKLARTFYSFLLGNQQH